MDLYTKSILAVLAMAVLMNSSNPWSQPLSKWTEFRDRVGRIESQLISVSSFMMAVAVLINAINPWGNPVVALANSQNRAENPPIKQKS